MPMDRFMRSSFYETYFTYIERENLLCNSDGVMDRYCYSILYHRWSVDADRRGNYGAEDHTNLQQDENRVSSTNTFGMYY